MKAKQLEKTNLQVPNEQQQCCSPEAGCPVPQSLAGMQGVGTALGLPGGLGCSSPCCCSLGCVLFNPGPF